MSIRPRELRDRVRAYVCEEWRNMDEPFVNPLTMRPVKEFGPTYLRLNKLCGFPRGPRYRQERDEIMKRNRLIEIELAKRKSPSALRRVLRYLY